MSNHNVDKKPKDARNVSPCMTIKGADKAIEFYKKVLGATEKSRMDWPDGKLAHAELKIGDSNIMLGEAMPEKNMPATANGSFVYVDDVDAVLKKAKENGAKIDMEAADQFWGDRMGSFTDPFGQCWSIATHIEDVSEEEIKRRGDEFFKKNSNQKQGSAQAA